MLSQTAGSRSGVRNPNPSRAYQASERVTTGGSGGLSYARVLLYAATMTRHVFSCTQLDRLTLLNVRFINLDLH